MSESDLGMRLCAACQQWWATTAPTTWFSGRICPGCIAIRTNPKEAA